MSCTTRRADAGDAATIALLGRLTFRETFAHLFPRHEDDLRLYLDRTFNVGKIAASIGKAGTYYWIGMVDGLPVGYGKLKVPSKSPAMDADAPAQLQKIYVLSEFLSRKVGHALMDAIRAEGQRLAIDKAWLNVLSSNMRAIRFYERHGWTRAGEARFDIGSQSFHFLTLQTSWAQI